MGSIVRQTKTGNCFLTVNVREETTWGWCISIDSISSTSHYIRYLRPDIMPFETKVAGYVDL